MKSVRGMKGNEFQRTVQGFPTAQLGYKGRDTGVREPKPTPE